jgi:hypothetical protein
MKARSLRKLPLALALGALVAASPPRAWAQGGSPLGQASASPRDVARGLAAEALKLYELGQYAAASELFERADTQYPAPQYRVYTARAYAKSGKLRQAAVWYARAVDMTPPPGSPPSFRDAQKTAVDELAVVRGRVAVIHLDVRGAPAPDVAVTVDGEPVAPADWTSLPVDPGRHRVTATAAGFTGVSREVDIGEGAMQAVPLALTPVPKSTATPDLRTVMYFAAGVGGAGFFVAVVTGGVLAAKHSAIQDACPNMICTPAGRALINSTGPIDAANVAGWVVGMAGLAGVVALFVVERTGKTQTAVLPVVLPGGGGISITGGF